MTTNEIRTKFLNFFKSQGHSIIASDSLVPKDDPTVLFTTAGMQQFKPQFLGRIDGFTRAATCQKCLRTDDLDKVGKSDVHHTFFEMLGNFSFGDYFKREAIKWALEFLTVELNLPKEELWVSVYKDDDEAYNIWADEISKDRIVKLGDKSNFWPSNAKLDGPNGPCGPCSEIFYDYGVNKNCPNGNKCNPECNCGRFSEIWNLVFTQFNRKEGGVLESLPARNIDTGMGLERLAAVVQGVKSNYETDLFQPILKEIKDTIKGISEPDARIIADHIRAIVFGIADGVVPSNEGRGYVIRKLIVDVTDLVIRSGINKPLVHTFVDVVVKVMSQPYSEIIAKNKEIEAVVKRTEEAFIKVRQERVPEFKNEVRTINVKDNPKELGRLWFKFRDTFGLPMRTISISTSEVIVLTPQQEKIAESEVNKLMDEQKNRSRAGSKMMGDVFADQNLDLNVPKTEFLGYTQIQAEAQVLKVFSEGTKVRVILNRTPFYAEAGGQVGDTGFIHTSQARMRVEDTQKTNDIFIHSGVMEKGIFKAGDQVQAVIDEPRRQAIKRNHTATHLLQAALREVLGTHVKQQGSLVEEVRLRFDFTHPAGVRPEEMQKIENRLNELIQRADTVTTENMAIAEAKKKGALAFFAEKYGDTVRVVSIGDYSKEFCGGTHLSSTKEVEAMKIISEGSVAQGIRRVEAVTGKASVNAFLQQKKQQEQLKAQAQLIKETEKQKQRTNFDQMKSSLDDIMKQAQKVKGVSVITRCLPDVDINMLRKLSDLLKQKMPSGVFILGARGKQDACLIVSVTDDLVAKGIKANDIVNRLAPLFGGSGGGRPQLAQAGSKQPEKIESAIAQAKDMILV